MGKSFLVNSTLVERTGFIGHHFLCPKSLSFHGMATIAGFTKKFAIAAN
jgi:hypothetical protein